MLDYQLTDRIDRLFSSFDRPDSPGCALGIMHRGELVYQRGYGCANLEYGIPITSQTVFHLASVSKQFTAMAVALLEESGLLNSESDIHDVLPNLPDYGAKITVADLIHMTSGLRDCYHVAQYIKGLREDDFFNRKEALQIIRASKDLIFQPGERFWYCNSNYVLLALIVELTTGQTLPDFARRNIFEPLGMKTTFFRDDATLIIPNRAQGYCKYDYLHAGSAGAQGADALCNALENAEVVGAGQAWSTLEDLTRWVTNFRQNRLGRKDRALIGRVTEPWRLKSGEPAGYGYGLFFSTRRGRQVIMHEGGSIGTNTGIYTLPGAELTVIVLANTNYTLPSLYRQNGMLIYESITDLILDGDIQKPAGITSESPCPKPGEHSPGALGFQDPCSSTIWKTSAGADGGLVVDVNGESQLRFERAGTDAYRNGSGTQCQIERDEHGNATRIMVSRDADSMEMLPFFSVAPERDHLLEYEGEYRCAVLDSAYTIKACHGFLRMRNRDGHRNGLNFDYQPSIKDFFYTYQPPYLSCYFSIEFRRNDSGVVTGFVFRDYDGDKREVFEYARVQ